MSDTYTNTDINADNKADIGLIGLAVMGQNLVMNMSDHGYRVAVTNRTTSKMDELRQRPGQRHERRRL